MPTTALFSTLLQACQFYVAGHRKSCRLPFGHCTYVLIPPNLQTGILNHRLKIVCPDRTDTWKTIAGDFGPLDVAQAKKCLSTGSQAASVAPAPVASELLCEKSSKLAQLTYIFHCMHSSAALQLF